MSKWSLKKWYGKKDGTFVPSLAERERVEEQAKKDARPKRMIKKQNRNLWRR